MRVEIEATVLGVRYERGEFNLTQGHKGYERNHYSRTGTYINNTGYGWARESKPSRLILQTEIGGQYYEIWIDRFFKDNLGRLTEKRRNIIQCTAPTSVLVDMHEGKSGNIYFTVTESDMVEWLERVRDVMSFIG